MTTYNALFEPDVLLPEQFADFVRVKPKSPEKRLMWALFADVLHCLVTHHQVNNRHAQRLFNEAWEWIFSEPEVSWLYSFSSVCDHLNLEQDSIRSAIKKKFTADERPHIIVPRLQAGQRHA